MKTYDNPILLDIRDAEEEHKLLHVVDHLNRIHSLIECAGFAADGPSTGSEVGNAISFTLQTAASDLQAVIDGMDEIRPREQKPSQLKAA